MQKCFVFHSWLLAAAVAVAAVGALCLFSMHNFMYKYNYVLQPVRVSASGIIFCRGKRKGVSKYEKIQTFPHVVGDAWNSLLHQMPFDIP